MKTKILVLFLLATVAANAQKPFSNFYIGFGTGHSMAWANTINDGKVDNHFHFGSTYALNDNLILNQCLAFTAAHNVYYTNINYLAYNIGIDYVWQQTESSMIYSGFGVGFKTIKYTGYMVDYSEFKESISFTAIGARYAKKHIGLYSELNLGIRPMLTTGIIWRY